MHRILLIQTAFIGDVVLATALIEKLGSSFPETKIDFLLRKGNEGLLMNNPYINEVIIWDKKNNKTRGLLKILSKIRDTRYDKVINMQRFFSTGLLTAFSGAKETRGFNKNPLSFLFSKSMPHITNLDHPLHETERNQSLISDFTNNITLKPKLYPSVADENSADMYRNTTYVTMTPSSVWFTKKFPAEKWIELINNFNPKYSIYLLGGKDNVKENEAILARVKNNKAQSLAGKMNFLQSAALMKSAVMNYVNDSAPLHFCSAVNAPVTAIFCSTVPAFGFYPLSDISFIVETEENLPCRPCGLHGKKVCPEGHFKCAFTIPNQKINETTNYHAA